MQKGRGRNGSREGKRERTEAGFPGWATLAAASEEACLRSEDAACPCLGHSGVGAPRLVGPASWLAAGVR